MAIVSRLWIDKIKHFIQTRINENEENGLLTEFRKLLLDLHNVYMFNHD